MNIISIDYTLIAQILSFLFFIFIIGTVVYIAFFKKKRQNDKEILDKLDQIINLLENSSKK